ncbi:MAG: response regulator [Myxococcota bacterium]
MPFGTHISTRHPPGLDDEVFFDLLIPHVVIAEDDADLRQLLAAWLNRAGIHTTVVADGVELSQLLGAYLAGGGAGFGIDAIISDVRMPGATGLDALEALRKRDPSLPVLLITAFDDEVTRREAARMGARVTTKPFAREELLRELTALGVLER